jgi:hypothetical protein
MLAMLSECHILIWAVHEYFKARLRAGSMLQAIRCFFYISTVYVSTIVAVPYERVLSTVIHLARLDRPESGTIAKVLTLAYRSTTAICL